jgi:hypothetical protein
MEYIINPVVQMGADSGSVAQVDLTQAWGMFRCLIN